MKVAKERVSQSQFLPVWVRHEHTARYQFASTFVAGKTVLDCACGDGTSSKLFAQSDAALVHGIDVSAESVESAARSNSFSNLKFQVGDATALPFESQSIDVYVSLETIEHLPDDSPYLREAVRVLKPGGVFICSTPNRDVTNPGKTLTDKPWNPFHVREYNAAEFDARLKNYFGEIEMLGQNPKNQTAVNSMQFIGKILPFHGAVRINQVFKLPSLLFDKLDHHSVRKRGSGTCFEYCVSVCRKPIVQPS